MTHYFNKAKRKWYYRTTIVKELNEHDPSLFQDLINIVFKPQYSHDEINNETYVIALPFPETKNIKKFNFKTTSALKAVIIHKDVEQIEAGAFYFGFDLSVVSIPYGLTKYMSMRFMSALV